MSSTVFGYHGVQNTGSSLRFTVEEMFTGAGWLSVECQRGNEESACGYIAREDMVRLGEAILWTFRDNCDESKLPADHQWDIERLRNWKITTPSTPHEGEQRNTDP